MQKWTLDSFIEKSNQIHNNQYDYNLVVFKSVAHHVNIVCPTHGIFSQVPSDHLRGRGCKKCGHSIQKMSFNDFVDASVKKYGSKFSYDETTFVNTATRMAITCDIHGKFEQSPYFHLKNGCTSCEGKGKIRSKEHFIKNIKDSNVSNYDFSETIYTSCDDIVTIRCKEHGHFSKKAATITRGHGCNKCTIDNKLQYHYKKFIKESSDIHSNKYTYECVEYVRSNKKVKIKCPNHGYFLQTPSNHKKGDGCPCCGANSSSNKSYMETAWLDSLCLPDDNQHRTVRLKMIDETYIVADGFDPATNTIYEFWGDAWHGNPVLYNPTDVNPRTKTTYGSLYSDTLRKIDIIKKSKYNIVSIWEYEWKEHVKQLGVSNVNKAMRCYEYLKEHQIEGK